VRIGYKYKEGTLETAGIVERRDVEPERALPPAAAKCQEVDYTATRLLQRLSALAVDRPTLFLSCCFRSILTQRSRPTSHDRMC
jgi:hypothetical protein